MVTKNTRIFIHLYLYKGIIRRMLINERSCLREEILENESLKLLQEILPY